MRRISLILLVAVLPLSARAAPVFENLTSTLGLSHAYTGGWEHFVGGGLASFDCNGDLLPELYVAGGDTPAVLYRNTSTRGEAVSVRADTPAALALQGVVGAYPLDIDNDGILDLFVLRVGANKLFKGGPNCRFTELEYPGLNGGDRWTTAFSATWERGNSLPTLATGNYVDRKNPDGPFEACDTNFLWRPMDGQYTAMPLLPAYCPLSMQFSDWGRKGRQDLRVSNDRHYYVRGGAEQMWAMEAKPRLYGAADGWKKTSIWGMGIASRDITGDGIPEVLLTSMGDQKLQSLDPTATGPTYVDATYDRGTTAQRPYTGGDGRPSTGWQVAFGDVNNDGRDDIFIAKGNVDQMPGSAMQDPNNLLMQQPNGQFHEEGGAAGIATMARSRGAALVDLDLDGKLDLFVVNRRAPVEIYRNTTPDAGNWLLLDVHQDDVNTRAVGGWIEVTDGTKTWSREITVGGGQASGSAVLNHFGLGNANEVRVRMIWPDGVESPWKIVQTSRIWGVERTASGLAISAR